MTFAARPDERLFERPTPPRFGGKFRFTLILAICFLLHAIPIALFLKHERPDEPAPAEQEIPVEIVAEPPPAPKEPDPPPPKPEQPPRAALDETIATDAPRAPNDEKLKDVKDETTHAPKTAPDSPPPISQAASQAAPASEKAIAPTPQPMEVRDDGDPVKPVEQEKPDPQDPVKALQAALNPQPQPAPSQAAATVFAALPDYSFAPLSRHAPTALGKAASTYLSVVYGMVMARGRLPESAAPRMTTTGDINFSIDLSGRLLRARIVKSCGAPEADAAELAAIRAAAPFPPTPTGTGLDLNLHYGR